MILVTVVSCLAWAFIAFLFYPPNGMTPNEWGDYIAGLAGGLAFLWLVRGLFLQREELGMQRQELQLMREEYERQTQLLREELDLRRTEMTAEVRPVLRLTGRGKSVANKRWIHRCFVHNSGGTALDLELASLGDLPFGFDLRFPAQDLRENEKREFQISGPAGTAIRARLLLRWTDRAGNTGEEQFEFNEGEFVPALAH